MSAAITAVGVVAYFAVGVLAARWFVTREYRRALQLELHWQTYKRDNDVTIALVFILVFWPLIGAIVGTACAGYWLLVPRTVRRADAGAVARSAAPRPNELPPPPPPPTAPKPGQGPR
ncbi:hypothetical protein IU421_13440 [Nocardia cyriacigeorgica]|uniref:hypothetical protein n=1 Tax=Nocardia cyriacigeorgica TaxID=135487 RepID=UPI0018934C2A|nr:hypothetical protein [Nocardia cyriacigeorgica]MBF6515285.1 hypothetical protein [Nocardia cyriacigeorgica]